MYNNYGEKLRVLRRGVGMTQGVLADEIGMNKSYLSQIECGHRNPTVGTLKKICEGLGYKLSIIIEV